MVKSIFLNELHLKNFKGIKKLDINFSKVTNIYGENGTGKTSIFDAFTWLLFDKDSQDRTVGDKELNFQIKTFDSKGQIVHGLEHTVTGTLNVDGKNIILSKTYKEKWTKQHGDTQKNLTGHTTLYYIDEVPLKKGEYQNKISEIIDEQPFKLLSNPLYFSNNLKWQKRRETLLDIIGNTDNETIISSKKDLSPLLNLLKDKSIEDLKKQITSRKRKLNEDIKSIPVRVDEASNSIREVDFTELENKRDNILKSLKDLDLKITDGSKINNDLLKLKDRLYSLKSKQKELHQQEISKATSGKNVLIKKQYELDSEILKETSNIKFLNNEKSNISKSINAVDTNIKNLREQWEDEYNKTFNMPEDMKVCPTCHRPFDDEDIEIKKKEMEGNFNENKAKKCKELGKLGQNSVKDLEKLKMELQDKKNLITESENKLQQLNQERSELAEKIDNFKVDVNMDDDKEYQELSVQVGELEVQLSKPINQETQTKEIQTQKEVLQKQLDEVNGKLAFKQQNEQLKNRIEELNNQGKKLAQQFADTEKTEDLIDNFIKTKVQFLEDSINNKFTFVKFKLFETQVNGGLNETCEALINGVPFSNANTASQYNAGIDIINALSKHYGVQAPIFIDGRESVNSLIFCDSPIVNLIVSKDKELKIESEEI